MESARALRPMGLLEIIDQTFRLYRSDFWLLFGISAIPYLPAGALIVVLQFSLTGVAMARPGAPTAFGAAIAIGFLMGLVIGAASLLATAALTKAISDRYLGRPVTVKEAYAQVARRFWPFLGTMIVGSLFVMSGAVLLFIGAMVFAFWIGFLVPVFVIEDRRYFTAIWCSKFLIGHGVWAQLFALMLAIYFLQTIIQYPISMVAMLPTMLAGPGATPGAGAMILMAVGSGISMALVQPLGLTASVLLYYDSRIRKEGFDLQILAREMGAQLPPPAEPPAITPPATPAPPDEGSV